MRVLWFTYSTAKYKLKTFENGWIASLQTEIEKCSHIHLGISFYLDGEPAKVLRNGVTYYPMPTLFEGSVRKKLKALLTSLDNRDKLEVNELRRVVEDFKPDVIEVFGSESSLGLVSTITDTPVILHIQGYLNPCHVAYLPPYISKMEYSIGKRGLMHKLHTWRLFKGYQHQAKREAIIIKNIPYFFGRTTWDKRITRLYNPNAHYIYCNEVLRQSFYENEVREIPDKLILVTTISQVPYKGYDTILKTAMLLKDLLHLDFEWKVYGNIDRVFERIFKINPNDVNIHLMGHRPANEVSDSLLNCTAYIHPSYIDNSPNAVCEAQILGCTVIASNVGGIPSLIDEGETGYMVPTNDPYQLAYEITELYHHPELNKKIGEQARIAALKRHDKKTIVDITIGTYRKMIAHK
jgi:glycosyltransferase involved in cell wall biosynthesis